ncbi:15951_t:CDS:2, partial [Gigaspora rosea]
MSKRVNNVKGMGIGGQKSPCTRSMSKPLSIGPKLVSIPKTNAEEVAKFIYKEIICRHGCPSILLSDQGSHFQNRVIDELLTTLSCRIKIGDKCDRLEPANPINTICVSYCKTSHDSRNALLLGVQQKSPVTLHPSASEDLLNRTIMQRIYEIENDLPEVYGNVLCRIKEAQQKQKAQYNRHVKATSDLDIDDRKGPYYVHDRLPNGAYKLRETTGR